MKHPIDTLAHVPLRSLRGSRRTFHRGWGDERLLPLNDAATFRWDEVSEIEVTWGPEIAADGLVVADGTFESPAPALPAESRTAVVRRVAPPEGARAWCVWMAAWNDHEWATRTALARLAAAHGIGSVILMNPYYGMRRPRGAGLQPIATVSDFGVMGRAAVIEGAALLRSLRSSHLPLGVAGYSMGANIGAMVSAVTGFPIATAALAVSHSPAPIFLTGPPRSAVAWSALGPKDAAVGRLGGILGSASVLRLPRPAHADAAVLVGSRRDGFVPHQATIDLHAHWPGSELRWLRGGHATMLWFARNDLNAAVVRAFDRLRRRASGTFET